MAQVKSLQTGIKFKDTPIGKVPVDWEVLSLSQVAEINMGQSPPSGNYHDKEEGLPFYQGNADFGPKYPTPSRWCNKPLKVAGQGDILISVRAPVGEINVAPHNCCIGRGIAAIRVTSIDSHFLYQAMLFHRKALEKVAQGSTFEAINRKDLSDFLILAPPTSEQKKIAEILTTVDDTIEETDRIIEKTKELKKGLMQKLLTCGIGHKKFKKTEIGEIPAEWKMARMDEVAKIERGKFQFRPRNEPRFYGGKYPFVQTGDVTNSHGRIREYSQTLNEEGLAISKLFPKGTVLITIAANIGDTAVAEFDLAFPDSLIGIITNEALDNHFLEYYLRTRKQHLNRLSTQSAQKNINLETLKPYPVPIPSRNEQNKIVKILSKLDSAEEDEERHKNNLDSLKKSLMQVLLTGRVRVKLR
jgi:type I restriction enzyme, S subunit